MERKCFKILFLGGGGCGRFKLVEKQLTGRFCPKYWCSCCVPDRDEEFRTTIDVDGESVNLDMFVGTDHYEYSALRDQYMRSADGYIICYSITSPVSLLEAHSYREQLYRVLDKEPDERVPIVLCGNKCDLESERQVSTEEGQKLADEWRCPFLETSSKDGINIPKVFECIVKEIVAVETESQRQEEEQKMKHTNIVMIGDKGVGKTGIINKQIKGKEYNAKVRGNIFHGAMKVEGEDVEFDIKCRRIDGKHAITDEEIVSAEGFLLVYSITSMESFTKMIEMHQRIRKLRGEQFIPVVVCGNKCDLEKQRKVQKEEAQRIVNESGCCLFETSGKEGINVKVSFVQLIRQIWKVKGYIPLGARKTMHK